MKKLIHIIQGMAVMATVVLLAACQKEESYLKVVPSDTMMNVSVDLGSLAKKGDLGNNVSLNGLANTAMLALDRETQEYAKLLLETPQLSGIDFTKPMVMMVNSQGQDADNTEVGVVLAVCNKEAVRKCLDTFVKSGVTYEEKGDVTLVRFGDEDEDMLAYDETSFVLWVSKKRDVASLFSLSAADQAIQSNEVFKQMVDSHADIAYACDYSQFSHLYEEAVRNSEANEQFDTQAVTEILQSMKVLSTTNFEDGKIVTETRCGGVNQDLMNCYAQATGRDFNYLPSEAIAVAEGAVKQLPTVGIFYDKMFKGKISEFLTNANLSMEDLNEIEGDVCLSFIGMEEQLPMVYFAADVKGDKLWNALKAELVKDDQVQEQSADRLILLEKYVIGKTADRIFCMPVSYCDRVIKDGQWVALDENFNQNRTADQIKKMGLAIDFAALGEMLSTLDLGMYQAVAQMAVSKFDYAVASNDANDMLHAKSECVMTDKKTNSFKQIVNLVEDVIRQAAAGNAY